MHLHVESAAPGSGLGEGKSRRPSAAPERGVWSQIACFLVTGWVLKEAVTRDRQDGPTLSTSPLDERS